jgi:hypothetical protein
VIDRVYSLEEVPEAMRYFGEGGAKGKVVITVAEDGGVRPPNPDFSIRNRIVRPKRTWMLSWQIWWG